MAIKVTLGSTKAGVGKTTQTANLGGILADLRRQILLVDIDIQPTLSSNYLIQSKETYGFIHLITETRVDDAINLNIVLSNDLQGRLQNMIHPTSDGPVRLKHILICLEDTYNFILIDTQRVARYRRFQHRGLPVGRHSQTTDDPLKIASLEAYVQRLRNHAVSSVMNGSHTYPTSRLGNRNKLTEK